jgi:hypothetical protein
MIARIPVADAVGRILSHDITEIRPGEFKGTPFPGAIASGKRISAASSGSARSMSIF